MIYWPLSHIAHSPLLAGPYALELQGADPKKPLSQRAAEAAFGVASETPSVELLSTAVVENPGTSHHYLFTDYPDSHEWLRLERAGITIKPDGQVMLFWAPLH